ncbi:MAG: HD family phosphohydrolase [Lachnospiraceae bacterium]|nr:HD family phosphohydrolase [Lachnospiraceae bacterium]
MKKTEKRLSKIHKREEFWPQLSAMMEDPVVMELKKYPNHRVSNLYDHSVRVALCAYDLSRRLHIKVDGSSMAKGAMLHDYYLYHAQTNKSISYREHLFGHPMCALTNAREHFELTPKEENIITSHMWPLTFFHVPRSKEAFLVQLSDKICAFGEGVLKSTHYRREHYERLAALRSGLYPKKYQKA